MAAQPVMNMSENTSAPPSYPSSATAPDTSSVMPDALPVLGADEADGDHPDAVPADAPVGGSAGETAVEGDRIAMIRAAAYQRYLDRGSEHGDADRDWLDAEAEIDAGNRSGQPDDGSVR